MRKALEGIRVRLLSGKTRRSPPKPSVGNGGGRDTIRNTMLLKELPLKPLTDHTGLTRQFCCTVVSPDRCRPDADSSSCPWRAGCSLIGVDSWNKRSLSRSGVPNKRSKRRTCDMINKPQKKWETAVLGQDPSRERPGVELGNEHDPSDHLTTPPDPRVRRVWGGQVSLECKLFTIIVKCLHIHKKSPQNKRVPGTTPG